MQLGSTYNQRFLFPLLWRPGNTKALHTEISIWPHKSECIKRNLYQEKYDCQYRPLYANVAAWLSKNLELGDTDL